MRHRGRADLALLESLGDGLVARHEADRHGQRAHRRAQLHEDGQGVEVEGARVDLADGVEDLAKAQAVGDLRLQLRELRLVTAQQVQHVLRGTHRALDSAQRVACQQLLGARQAQQQLIGRGSKALAQGGGLRGDVVGTARHHEPLVLAGQAADAVEDGDALIAGQHERAVNLQLLHVLREIAGGHTLVDLLEASEVVELLNAGLHVVAGDLLPLGDGGQVHLVEDLLIGGRSLGRDLDAEFLLSLHHGEPELALHLDLLLRGPQVGHLRGGIAGGEDVGNILLCSSHAPHYPTGAPGCAVGMVTSVLTAMPRAGSRGTRRGFGLPPRGG